jgi:hypothetical protein
VHITLDIDDDVLAAARELARRPGTSAGQMVSRLLRAALNGSASPEPPAPPISASFRLKGLVIPGRGQAKATRTSRRPRMSNTCNTSTARTQRNASRSTDSVPELAAVSAVRQGSQRQLAGVETATPAAIQACE